MKTQETKNRETVKSSNLTMYIYLIAFSHVIFANVYGESNEAVRGINSMKIVAPVQQNFHPENASSELETEKLLRIVELKEKAVNRQIESSIAKLNMYLIAEDEPVFDLETANSIVFPKEPMDNTKTVYENGCDSQLAEMKAQAKDKTRKAVEFYAMEKKIKEYLVVDKEQPLELENWMTDKKCWCPELREAMAIAEQK